MRYLIYTIIIGVALYFTLDIMNTNANVQRLANKAEQAQQRVVDFQKRYNFN